MTTTPEHVRPQCATRRSPVDAAADSVSDAITRFREAFHAAYGRVPPGVWEVTTASSDWTTCRAWHPVGGGSLGDVIVGYVGRSGQWTVEGVRGNHSAFFRGDVQDTDLMRLVCKAVDVLSGKR